MAKVSEHCEDCLRELGDEFLEVNLWLDELFDFVGSAHRDIRHNELGIRKIREKWGEKAGRAAEIHIMRDCDCIPKVDDEFTMKLSLGNSNIYQAFLKEYEDYDL